jgi:hypothetical protein
VFRQDFIELEFYRSKLSANLKMKMKRGKIFKAAIFSAISMLWVTDSMATSTLQFANVGRLTGFSANGDTDGTDGMRWGVVIDTGNLGFTSFLSGATEFDPFTGGVLSSGFLSVGGVVSTNYYFHAGGNSPVTSTQTAIGLDPGGVGGVVSITTVPNGNDSLVDVFDSGDPFAIMWFDGAPISGNYYGLFTTAAFTLPATGTVSYSAPFNTATAEPIKQANIQFGAAAIPEPSRVMLLSFGLLGLCFRRRR